MNKRLDEVMSKVRALPDAEQQAVAELLSEYLEGNADSTWLTPEQVAEIERRLDDNDIATDEETKVFFDSMKS